MAVEEIKQSQCPQFKSRRIESNCRSQLFAVALIWAISKPVITVWANNVGLPASINIFLGLISLLNFCLLAIPRVRYLSSKIDFFWLCLIFISFVSVLSSAVGTLAAVDSVMSFVILPFTCYLAARQSLRNFSDFDRFIDIMSIYSVFLIFFGVCTSIFGYPEFISMSGGEYYTGAGTLRVRSFTSSEQTYYILTISIVLVGIARRRHASFLAGFFLLTQLPFYPAKNPMIFALLAVGFARFFSRKYSFISLLVYFTAVCWIFHEAIASSDFNTLTIEPPWLRFTPFGVPSVIDRYWRWKINIQSILTNPMGFGAGTATKMPVDFWKLGLSTIHEPHNEYLRLAIEYSVLAPLILVGFFHCSLSTCRRLTRYFPVEMPLLAGIIFGFSFVCFFNNQVFGTEEKFIFWAFIALIENLRLKA